MRRVHVAVSAVGTDRPGIVAAVTEVLYRLGCNIEDSRMAILGGHFSMMLIVDVPNDLAADLERELAAPADRLDLVVGVRPIADAATAAGPGVDHVVSVYGADRPGIVWRVSSALADRGVNISDLATHVVPGDPPVYVMILEVAIPAGEDAGALAEALRALGRELGVDLSMRPMEPETL